MKALINIPKQIMKQQVLIDKLIALLILLFAIFVVVFAISKGRYMLHLPIILLISVLFYLRFRENILKAQKIIVFPENNRILLVMNIIYVIILSLLIWLSWSNLYFRPISYFVLFLVAVASIIVNILLCNDQDNMTIFIILMKIMCLSLLFYSSIFYEFPGIYGTDPWIHNALIHDMISRGHIPFSLNNITFSEVYHNSYYSFPVFHLENAIVEIITSLSYSNSIFLSVGILMAMSCIFVFLIARSIVSVKSGLLIALIIPFTSHNIEKATEIIPMSLGYILFLIIMYFVFSPTNKKMTNKTLLVIISFTLIITHTIAALATLLCLIGLSCGMNFAPQNTRNVLYNRITYTFILFFVVVLFLKWTENSIGPTYVPFFDAILTRFVSTLRYDSYLPFSGISSKSTPSNMSGIEILLNISGFLILSYFGLIGALKYLHKKYYIPTMLYIMILAGIFYSIIGSSMVVNLLDILPDRWYIFAYVPMSILAIEGILATSNLIKNQTGKLVLIISVLLIIILSMQFNLVANKDSPFIFNNAFRYGYTQSEFTAIDTLSNINPGTLVTDIYFAIAIQFTLPFDNLKEISMLNNNLNNKEMFIQRNYYLNNPQWNQRYKSYIIKGRGLNILAQDLILNHMKYMIDNSPMIYNNGNVKVYISTPV